MMLKFMGAAMLCITAVSAAQAAALEKTRVDQVIEPLMKEYQIPGMAVAVSIDGKTTFYNYGVSSKETRLPIDQNTLFEIGSLSKTFTATLASWAQLQGKIAFDDPASRYISELKGTAFDKVSLLNLATHTSGLPLFEPDGVKTDAQLMSWFKEWQPAQPAGTQRIYSNMGIGLLGLATANSLKQPFTEAMQKRLLPAFGMHNSFVQVPANKMANYAMGYNKQDKPVRVNPGVLDAEAYGLKSSSADLIRYLDINMNVQSVEAQWHKAVEATHTGYYHVSGFTQDMMWESYPYPTPLNTLLENNSSKIIYDGHPASAILPPQAPMQNAIYNKTGSTSGFSTYALFVPARKMAIIILANKSYPNEARVKAAYDVLNAQKGGF
ncbi:class C beta-lactamase [Rouxiella silvae]